MIATSAEYHRFTGYDRYRMSGHALDWANQPDVYKDYPGLPVVPLPPVEPRAHAGLSQLVRTEVSAGPPESFSLERLSGVFALAYSLTARSRHAGGDFYYRSVPSAGALYPCELYVASRALSGLPDGLYHYAVGRHGLVPLRSGDFLEPSGASSSSGQAASAPSLVFLVTAIFFRSAWKYRARSYRYHLMDSGHLLESLILALKAASVPGEATFDFDDEAVDAFLGCDRERESCLATVSAGPAGNCLRAAAIGAAAGLPEAFQAASRVSAKEVAYPALQEFHQACSQVKAPTGPVPEMIQAVSRAPASWQALPAGEIRPEQLPFGETVRRRRSYRNYLREAIPPASFQALSALLGTPGEAPGSNSLVQQQSVAVGFLIGNVAGIDPGCYWLDRSTSRLGMTKAGSLTASMAHACLDQEWLAQASLHCFVATNLELLEEAWGPRGYRYAMLTAGRLGHRLYLGATALGLGCCGIGAFYDEEAAALLELNDASAMLYLLAVGPVKRLMP